MILLWEWLNRDPALFSLRLVLSESVFDSIYSVQTVFSRLFPPSGSTTILGKIFQTEIYFSVHGT